MLVDNTESNLSRKLSLRSRSLQNFESFLFKHLLRRGASIPSQFIDWRWLKTFKEGLWLLKDNSSISETPANAHLGIDQNSLRISAAAKFWDLMWQWQWQLQTLPCLATKSNRHIISWQLAKSQAPLADILCWEIKRFEESHLSRKFPFSDWPVRLFRL